MNPANAFAQNFQDPRSNLRMRSPGFGGPMMPPQGGPPIDPGGPPTMPPVGQPPTWGGQPPMGQPPLGGGMWPRRPFADPIQSVGAPPQIGPDGRPMPPQQPNAYAQFLQPQNRPFGGQMMMQQ